MRQKQIKRLPGAIVFATTVVGALDQFGEVIGLRHVTKALFEGARNELVAARDNLDVANVELAASRVTRNSIAQTARAFLVTSRDALKNTLGKKITAEWESAGFRGTFQVSANPDQVQLMLESLQSFLGNHPEMEVAQFNVTAARAASLFSQLVAAQLAVQTQVGNVSHLRMVRDEKFAALKWLIAQLIKELTIKLDPLDAKWLQFGLNQPGAVETPEVPEEVTAELVDDNAIDVRWVRAPRAAHYRVWAKVQGVDEEAKAVGSPTDRDFMIKTLPSNSRIEIALSAVNSAGESRRSRTVVIVTR